MRVPNTSLSLHHSRYACRSADAATPGRAWRCTSEGRCQPSGRRRTANRLAHRVCRILRRCPLLLLRFRFHVITEKGREARRELLAEEAGLLAFEGAPATPTWLDPAAAEALLDAAPTSNLDTGLARDAVQMVVADLPVLDAYLTAAAKGRAAALHAAHKRVREAANSRVKTREVAPQPPVDVLGVYVFLPDAKA